MFVNKILKKQKFKKDACKVNEIAEIRNYKLSCPPRPSGTCGCQPQIPSYKNIMPPPASCRKVDIPPNPCVPRYHHGKDTWKKYKYFALFVCFPLILIQTLHVLGHKSPPKEACLDYEYMRRRTKRFPWGDGIQSLLHNERVNHLPGECEPPPLECD
ncbi:unnamed protein product [Parnassius mnemosyne]|uniref:Uncharacterized protein n=1 Tax=Parnassius mnemosyne TaxID=213953 RepID=A0AAV1LWT3_9NEOP